MPLYFFHVADRTERDPVRDQPREYPDLKTALAEAHAAARAMLHRRVRRGPIALRGSLDVHDEGHRPVARILFADVARQIS